MKLSELSEENLIRFYIQAISFYKCKTFIIGDNKWIIKNVDELETEMFVRSQDYWKKQIDNVKDTILRGS